MFGAPSGLGALIVSKAGAAILQKRYFGGGTVTAATASKRFHELRPHVSARFEDGTVPFGAIAQLQHGFDRLRDLGIQHISSHVHACAYEAAKGLLALTHSTGAPVCHIYGAWSKTGDCCKDVQSLAWDPVLQGGVVTFNLLRASGKWVGYSEVEQAAVIEGIHLRTGLFCNPGAGERYLEISSDEVKANLRRGHVCWDKHDLIDGKPTGAVRVSFGYMSTIEDAAALVRMISQYFVERLDHPMVSELFGCFQ